MATSTSMSPEWRQERARKGAAARHSLETYVSAVVKRAPELTPEQVAKLRAALAEGRV